ncbi:Adenylyl cyclase-associated protein [Schistosoma japonicum]|nr:Adenylyl cyclase-associated protein [Schistosoma japonicum]
MDRKTNWLKYLLCKKHHHKFGKNGDKDCANCVKKSSLVDIKQIDQEGSVKEILSPSTISHTPGAGDGSSASLGDWSTVHQLDGVDTSKVNILCDGGSSNTSNILGVSNRIEFCDHLESIVTRLERIARLLSPEKPAGLVAFESLIANSLKKYVSCSKKLGGSIQFQSLCVQNAFVFVRDLIELSSIYGKPNEEDMDLHLKPLHFKMIEIASRTSGLEPCHYENVSYQLLRILFSYLIGLGL